MIRVPPTSTTNLWVRLPLMARCILRTTLRCSPASSTNKIGSHDIIGRYNYNYHTITTANVPLSLSWRFNKCVFDYIYVFDFCHILVRLSDQIMSHRSNNRMVITYRWTCTYQSILYIGESNVNCKCCDKTATFTSEHFYKFLFCANKYVERFVSF
jgi:hypothetical protein